MPRFVQSDNFFSGGALICSRPVESANDRLASGGRLSGIVGVSHTRCQTRQFASAKLSFRIELIGETNDAELFFRVEPSYLFNNLSSSHISRVLRKQPTINLARSH